VISKFLDQQRALEAQSDWIAVSWPMCWCP